MSLMGEIGVNLIWASVSEVPPAGQSGGTPCHVAGPRTSHCCPFYLVLECTPSPASLSLRTTNPTTTSKSLNLW